MTIAGSNGYRFFLRLFALVNALFAGILFALTRPPLSTPLFEFPLLASLHAVVLGTLVPLLLARFSDDSPFFRVSILFIAVGDLVLVTGFLLHPRSLIPQEGGLMVTAGLLIGGVTLLPGSWRFLYWSFLCVAAGLGILLGGVLARPAIDPIPFSMIAVHGLLGAGLGLFPLFWLRTEGVIVRKSPVYFLAGGIILLILLVLQNTLVTGTMGVLSAGALLLSGAGVDRKGLLIALLCILVVGLLRLSGTLLPGEGFSLLGILLLGGCLAGFFRQRAG